MLKNKKTPELIVKTSGMPSASGSNSTISPKPVKDKKRKLLYIALGVLLSIVLLAVILKATGLIGNSDDNTKDQSSTQPQEEKTKKPEEPQSTKFISTALPELSATLGAGWTAKESDNGVDISVGIPEKYITMTKGETELTVIIQQIVARDFFSPECILSDYYDNITGDLYRIEDGPSIGYEVGVGANKTDFADYAAYFQTNYTAIEGGTHDFSKSNFCPDGLPMGIYASTVDYTEETSGGVEVTESGKLEFYITAIQLTGAGEDGERRDALLDEADEIVKSISGIDKTSDNLEQFHREQVKA